MTSISYEITDKYGNRFQCNHDPEFDIDDPNDQTFRIQVGSTRISPPCVTILIHKYSVGYRVQVLDLYFDKLCAEQDLATGAHGTQSMLLCALQMTKKLYPQVDEFYLQDESRLARDGHDVSLSNIYMLTRGKTWYESFLNNIVPKGTDYRQGVHAFKRTVSATFTMSFYDFMRNVFRLSTQEADDEIAKFVKNEWEKCYNTCSWFQFLHILSSNYSLEFWERYMSNILDTLDVITLRGLGWQGNLSNQSQRIHSVIKKNRYHRFGQSGGDAKSSRNRFFTFGNGKYHESCSQNQFFSIEELL